MAAEIVSMRGLPPEGGLEGGRKRSLLKDEAYLKIRTFLLQQDAEETFSERSLAATLEIGLGPVRLAVERLRVDGLIIVSPNSGLRLPEITSKDILDFYEFRMLIECHTVEALAGCLTSEQCATVEEILDEQDATARNGDTVRYHQLDLSFHTALTDFHGNPEMSHALRRMRDKMYRLARRMHGAHPERLEVNAGQHRAIFEEVRGGNAELARQRMKTHLDWGRRFTLDPERRLGDDWQQPEASEGL
jgi:DNA-binding GntR family transcriptional regulator